MFPLFALTVAIAVLMGWLAQRRDPTWRKRRRGTRMRGRGLRP